MIYTIDDNKIEIKIKRHWILKMIKERKILNKRLSKTLSEKRAKNINESVFSDFCTCDKIIVYEILKEIQNSKKTIKQQWEESL